MGNLTDELYRNSKLLLSHHLIHILNKKNSSTLPPTFDNFIEMAFSSGFVFNSKVQIAFKTQAYLPGQSLKYEHLALKQNANYIMEKQ